MLRQEALDHVQLWLGLVSLLLWFTVSYGIVLAANLTQGGSPSRIIIAGAIGLLFAALPWLAYRRLVRTEIDRRRARPRTR